jgi:hypothetical protein
MSKRATVRLLELIRKVEKEIKTIKRIVEGLDKDKS